MRVADFFCGAGGFSEGFRIQGFDVIFGLDNWAPAIATHKFNHPEAKHHLGNILEIKPEEIDKLIPDTEIIIGSPPCVSFSGSNKAGKADKSLGTALIEKFLQIIAVKKNKKGSKLKYWLLENVPNSKKHIKKSYTFKELNLPGGSKTALEIPVRKVLNSADYGTPQTRSRFVCGEYLLPEKVSNNQAYITMCEVMDNLGEPLSKKKELVKDICWNFNIDGKDLTDHYYDTRVQEFEWKAARRLKEDHGFMGKMSFPEELNRPSRTVMATQSAVSRESILFGTRNPEVYRLPTIREIACFMSFPITYQFEANSEVAKNRLVGNAVCPKLSSALAKTIKDSEKLNLLISIDKEVKKPSLDLTGKKRKQKIQGNRRPIAKFRRHIPYLKKVSLRVDLDNLDSDFNNKDFKWRVVLHRGTGKGAKQSQPILSVVKEVLKRHDSDVFENFYKELESSFDEGIPRANKFQENYVKNDINALGPEKALERIKEAIDKIYPEEQYGNFLLQVDDNDFCIGRYDLPIRIVAGLYACLWFVKRIGKNN